MFKKPKLNLSFILSTAIFSLLILIVIGLNVRAGQTSTNLFNLSAGDKVTTGNWNQLASDFLFKNLPAGQPSTQTISSDIDLVVDGTISGPEPTADDHLATKAYVDANSGGGGYIDWADCEHMQTVHESTGQTLNTTLTCSSGYTLVSYSCGGCASQYNEQISQRRFRCYCRLDGLNSLQVYTWTLQQAYRTHNSGSIKCCRYVE